MAKPTKGLAQLKAQSRRLHVAEDYLKGRSTQVELAERFGVNQSTIARDLQHIRKWWRDSAAAYVGQALQEELAKINRLEQEAWKAYESSRGKKIRTRATKRNGKDGQQTSATRYEEDQVGDPRFLERVSWCIDRRCKLLGLDAPENHNIHLTAGHVVNQTPQQLRAELLNEPAYLEYLRQSALDSDTGVIREVG